MRLKRCVFWLYIVVVFVVALAVAAHLLVGRLNRHTHTHTYMLLRFCFTLRDCCRPIIAVAFAIAVATIVVAVVAVAVVCENAVGSSSLSPSALTSHHIAASLFAVYAVAVVVAIAGIIFLVALIVGVVDMYAYCCRLALVASSVFVSILQRQVTALLLWLSLLLTNSANTRALIHTHTHIDTYMYI